ncbi:MAG: phosphomannomutase/phosphoglucomutase [Thermoleophilia bacterium]|nr:phosphomannomutase/phosphoglucomutase [Thermoleophilia bacterium]
MPVSVGTLAADAGFRASPEGPRPAVPLASARVLDPKVFKAYDVRGVYPTELDEEGAYAIGRAYVQQFEPRRIAVGRDMRTSAPAMARAVIDGAADGGADVLDIGMVGTEMLYFAVGELGLDGGICVTASHNPKEYTGMKIVRRGALPVGGESGLPEIRDRALAGFGRRERRGDVRDENVWPAYRERVLSFVDADAIRPLRVVIDAANGMAGAMLPPVLERVPVDARPYFFEPDGTFPDHEPNPLLPENREFIVRRTLEEEADLGVAFDGDADRCFFVDDTGEFVPGDFVTALLAEAVLEKEPGAKIIYDVRASWAVPDTIERAGGVPLVNRVGHAFIKHRMRKEGAAFGGEVSGHYYFRDFSQADSGVVPFLLVLEQISRKGRKLSEILQPYRERYFLTGELNTRVADVALKLQELKERFSAEGRVSHLDGISIEAEEWHFNVRPSNTEPLLRLNLEARSRELMERKRDEVLAILASGREP